MATGVDYNAVGDAAARAFPVKTSVMLLVTGGFPYAIPLIHSTESCLFPIGIQLFMFSFSVSVFCETPTGKRGKRWPFLLVSFIVFILFAASTSLDIVWKHDIIFNAKSGSDVMAAIAHDAPTQWSGRASILTLLAYVAVSDGIMVRTPVCVVGDGYLPYPIGSRFFGVVSCAEINYGCVCHLLSPISLPLVSLCHNLNIDAC